MHGKLPVPCALVAAILLSFLLTGCGTSQQQRSIIPEGAKIDLKSISIIAAPSANSGQTVPLDIVYVYDEAALRRLQGYTASGWFTVKETGLIDWQNQIAVQELQIEPGEKRTITEFPGEGRTPRAIVTFARYEAPGLHRYFVVGGHQIAIQLEQYGYRVGGQ